ncbi:MAG TPA: ABC transporter substrate-binding protein [Chloroflexota bacterium]|nr:ABC transporter substrate-binding protein [Chloroflexota bacterium]
MKLGFSQPGVGYGPFFAGKDAGFFSKNGLDVSLQQVNGPAAVPALLANEVQMDGFGANELSRAVLAGAPLVGIATLGDLPVFMLYADKKYPTVLDLVGQTVGVTAIGSSTDVTARLFLDHYGLLDKVKIAAVGGTIATELAALTQGVAAAVIVSPDAGVQAAKAGFIPIVDGVKLGVPLNFSVIAVTTTYLKDHPDTVKAVLRAYQQAWTYLGDPANKSAALDLLAKNTQGQPDAVEVGYTAWVQIWSEQKVPTINPQGIDNTLKFADDPKARAAKGEQFIDNSILQSIQ